MAQSKRPKLLVKKTIFSSWFETHSPYDGKVHGLGPCKIMLNDQPTPNIYKLISEIGFFMGPKQFRKQLLGLSHGCQSSLSYFLLANGNSEHFIDLQTADFAAMSIPVFSKQRSIEIAVLCISGAKALEDVDCQNVHEIEKNKRCYLILSMIQKSSKHQLSLVVNISIIWAMFWRHSRW